MKLINPIIIAVAKQVMLWEPQRRGCSHNISHLNPLGGCHNWYWSRQIISFFVALFLAAVLAIILSSEIAFAATIPAPVNGQFLDLTTALDIYIDRSGEITIDDIASPDFASHFSQIQGNPRNLGRIVDPIWLRFTMSKPPQDHNLKIIELSYLYIDTIDLYRPLPKGGYERSLAGDQRTVAEQEMPDRLVLLPIYQAPDSIQTYYLRYEDRSQSILSFKLWDAEGLRRERLLEQMLLGIFYGALLVLMIYSLTIYVAGRVRIYLDYVIYIFSLILFMGTQNGLLKYFFLTEGGFLQEYFNLGTIGFLGFGMLRFTTEFLDTRTATPRLHQSLRILQIFCLMLIPAIVLQPWNFGLMYIVLFTGLIVTFAISGITVYFVLVLKSRASWYLLIAFALPLLGALLMLARSLAWIEISMLTEFGMQIGSLIEMIVLAFGLSEHIAKLRIDKAIAELASLTDLLTGLGNRASLLNTLEVTLARGLRRHLNVAVMMIDLDGFKAVNDCFGHAIGDLLLQEIADRLRAGLRAEDGCFRLGGDEFVVVLDHVIAATQALQVAEKIRFIISQPMNLTTEAQQVQVFSSIGIALWIPPKKPLSKPAKINVTDILKSADTTMYAAKLAGKNQVQLVELAA